MVILEHEYQTDNPVNEQKRYVIIPTWEQYKTYLAEEMTGRYFNILEDSLGELRAEFKLGGNAKEQTFIHQAIVVRKKEFYLDEEVLLIDGGEDEQI